MKITRGNIWDYYDKGYTIAVSTNGMASNKGALVMGRGLAAQAKGRFHDLSMILGNLVGSKTYGNHVHHVACYRLFSFPTKKDWRNIADINLIRRSAVELMKSMERYGNQLKRGGVVMPKAGCGFGELRWEQTVKPVLESVFGNNTKIGIVDKI